MAGLEVTGVQAGQATTGATGGQPKQKQNIVIEFTSLPDKLKTKEVRAFYDKDGSGFIEAQNANGQNEYALMADFARSMGIDLSKYKSDITKVTIEDNGKYSAGYNSNGTRVRTLNLPADNGTFVYTENKQNNTMQGIRYDENFKPNGFTTSYDGKTWTMTRELLNYRIVQKNDNTTVTDITSNRVVSTSIKNKKGEYVNTYYEYKPLTKGKNSLELVNEYTNKGYTVGEQLMKKPDNLEVSNSTYTLNGKPVQAKPIGRGRYEITDDKGNVFYISHDGVKLKPEYVRNNP